MQHLEEVEIDPAFITTIDSESRSESTLFVHLSSFFLYITYRWQFSRYVDEIWMKPTCFASTMNANENGSNPTTFRITSYIALSFEKPLHEFYSTNRCRVFNAGLCLTIVFLLAFFLNYFRKTNQFIETHFFAHVYADIKAFKIFLFNNNLKTK